jgi:hypothetical protein
MLENITYLMWGLGAGVAFLSVRKRVPLALQLLGIYLLVQTFAYLYYYPIENTILSVFVLQSRVWTALTMVSGMVLFIAVLCRYENFFKMMLALFLGYAGIVSFQLFFHAHSYFLFNNATQAAWFVALSAPILLELEWKFCLPLVLFSTLAVSRTEASAPLFLMFLTLGCLVVRKRQWLLGLGAILLLLGVVIACAHQHLTDWLDLGFRGEAWGIALTWWKESWRTMLFGHGLGTVKLMIPYLQAQAGITGGGRYYIWLHNDWLQILCELGVVGLALSVWSAVTLIKKSIQKGMWHVGFALVLYGLLMVVQFPLHWPTFLFMAWCFCGAILEGKKT